ncbi:hypothetical protein V6N12_021359 [Hibiscus sabdariffa]|uniref:Uncharacterized protein n=1 Tax=Hibiscus sabdariffa TaxID=183260 RepID=A0ABR2FRE8_9ROSI
MGRSWFLKLLLLSMLLLLSFPQGHGRKVSEAVGFEELISAEEFAESRGMAEMMDYKDPGPNTNPKAGFIISPPPLS